jgi:hypothetical protein
VFWRDRKRERERESESESEEFVEENPLLFREGGGGEAEVLLARRVLGFVHSSI